MIRQNQRGVTLIEILVVITIILILAVLALPVLQMAKVRSKRAACLSQLRQQGIGFHMFAHDHESKFPMQVSTNNGGSLEFLRLASGFGGDFYFSFRHYQSLSPELETPKILACPADIRQPAESFADLRNTNISYFVAASADYAQPETILAGDRNITSFSFGSRSLQRLMADDLPGWTAEMHQYSGNLLFSDSHAAQTDKKGLRDALRQSPGDTLALPPVPAPSSSPSTAGAGSGSGHGSGASSSASAGPSGAGAGSSGGGAGSSSAGGRAANQGPPGATDANVPAAAPAQPRSTTTLSKPRMAAPEERLENPSPISKTNKPVRLPASIPASSSEPGKPNKDGPPDNLPAMIGQFMTSPGVKITYLLLLLLLAVLSYREIKHRKRMRERKRRKLE